MPVLIAVPHAGRAYPEALRNRMRAPDVTALRLEDRYVDVLAEGAAEATGAALLVADAPRAMIDLNRAEDDVDWSMIAGHSPGRPARASSVNRRARGGLGLIPRRLTGLGEIWRERTRHAELEARLATVHRPYHAALAATLESIRDRWGAALLIDLHSMPPLAAARTGAVPAEFVVGDRFGASCARSIVTRTLAFLDANGRATAHNRPYAGGFVLDRHAAPARDIHAIQIEICRSTYLDARFDRPGPRAPAVTRLIANLVRHLGEDVALMGGRGPLPVAAE
ncbi:N-formylglutamate amidohydrolase [Altererythrobacter aerius]|uniref:N-formylglutamate amidohydrolase n=2 Tax=Tsuneonella aeria TaxID=1837929 RepID=A0A6I4TBT6_9SPHN|nr:N-formylglutamate amidohydrolase [Tsuneonella aeria]